MKKYIHIDTIEEIKVRADIVDIISEYVVLEKKGKNLVGRCPFCKEEHPNTSFTVEPSHKVYYCFNCQAAGNVIKFLMQITKQDFNSTMIALAERCQIPIKYIK